MLKLLNYVRYGGPDLDGHKLNTDKTLYTPIYLSLYGGNTEADTTEERQPAGVDNLDWWGNLYQDATGEARFNSRFERTVMGTPFTSAAFKDFEKAIADDLEWLITAKIVKKLSSSFTLISQTRLEIIIYLAHPDDIEEKYQFLWENRP